MQSAGGGAGAPPGRALACWHGHPSSARPSTPPPVHACNLHTCLRTQRRRQHPALPWRGLRAHATARCRAAGGAPDQPRTRHGPPRCLACGTGGGAQPTVRTGGGNATRAGLGAAASPPPPPLPPDRRPTIVLRGAGWRARGVGRRGSQGQRSFLRRLAGGVAGVSLPRRRRALPSSLPSPAATQAPGAAAHRPRRQGP